VRQESQRATTSLAENTAEFGMLREGAKASGKVIDQLIGRGHVEAADSIIDPIEIGARRYR
jgi:hypothetical protein